jgi:peptidoglycan hydrolase-like protein with peptidoglycan-binding domain
MTVLSAIGLRRTAAPAYRPAGLATSAAFPAGRYTFDITITVRWIEPSWSGSAQSTLASTLAGMGARNVSVAFSKSGPQTYTADGRSAQEWFMRAVGSFDLPTATVADTGSSGVYRMIARGLFQGMTLVPRDYTENGRVIRVAAPTDGAAILARMLDGRFMPLPAVAASAREVIARVNTTVTRTGAIAGATTTTTTTTTVGGGADVASFTGKGESSLSRAEVSSYQTILRNLGYRGANGQPLGTDGVIGPDTRSAVRAFRLAYAADAARHSWSPSSLPSGDSLGPETQKALQRYRNVGATTTTTTPATPGTSTTTTLVPTTPNTPATPVRTTPTAPPAPQTNTGLSTNAKIGLGALAMVAAGGITWVLTDPGGSMMGSAMGRDRGTPTRRNGPKRRRARR